jgi:hypothetical protein
MTLDRWLEEGRKEGRREGGREGWREGLRGRRRFISMIFGSVVFV